jgi:PIN domain nuclease of toxin-antitoxin system
LYPLGLSSSQAGSPNGSQYTERGGRLLKYGNSNHVQYISAIVLWEIAKLRQLKRIEIEVLSVDFARVLSQIAILPIDAQISQTSTELDFNSDPADELIAATSIVHKVPLLTRDRKILSSRIVPFAKQ